MVSTRANARVGVASALAVTVLAAACMCHLPLATARPGELPTLLALINVRATTMELDDGIVLSVTPDQVSNGDYVTVTWSGVTNPNNGDWVGVYSPSTTNIMEHYPIKFKFANASTTGTVSGSGTLKFQLLNLRADYVFAFMRNGIYTPTLSAKSNVVSFADYNHPFQIHLALGSDYRFMKVMWSTLDASTPQAYYAAANGGAEHTRIATTTTYTAADLCGEPATTLGWRSPGLLHSATLGPLSPDTVYEYKVGDPSYGWSATFNFTSPKVPSSVHGVNIIAFGDLGRGEADGSIDGEYWRWGNYQPSLWTTNAMANSLDSFDLVLNIGDTSYADGVSSEWDEFFHQIAPIAQHKPWMTCIGNHELDWTDLSYSFFNSSDSGGECGIPQEMRFGLPMADGPQTPWYSMDYGNVHVTMMSSEHDFEAGSEQYAWIMKDLASINRTKTPWTIFAGHRPFYVDSTWNAPPDGDNYVAGLLRAAYEDALNDYKIDLGIMGHHHTYQRTCAVYKSECVQTSTDGVYTNPSAPVYNVLGMAGAPFTTNFYPTKPAYMEYVDDQNHGFYRINTNLTTMHAQFVSLDAELNEKVLDEFWIHRTPAQQ